MTIRIVFVLLLTLSVTLQTTAQSVSLRSQTYNAYLSADPAKWEALTAAYENKARHNVLGDLLQLVHCYYGYTMLLVEKKQDDKAAKCIEKAESYIDKILASFPNNALALDYKGVFISYRISLNKLKAPLLGKKSRQAIARALELEPDSPQILCDKGNSLFYPPSLFGGNKKEALVYYKKAISIIEQKHDTDQNWIYLKMLLNEARYYESEDNLTQAKRVYEKILSIEPSFRLVKDKLYPELLKKMK